MQHNYSLHGLSNARFCDTCHDWNDCQSWEYGIKYYVHCDGKNKICKKCWKNLCRIEKCRKCDETFLSRNLLFEHLKEFGHIVK